VITRVAIIPYILFIQMLDRKSCIVMGNRQNVLFKGNVNMVALISHYDTGVTREHLKLQIMTKSTVT